MFVYHRSGIQLVLNSKVQSVARNSVQINTNGKISTIAFGACVWSTGVAMHPLVKQLQVRSSIVSAQVREGLHSCILFIWTPAWWW